MEGQDAYRLPQAMERVGCDADTGDIIAFASGRVALGAPRLSTICNRDGCVYHLRECMRTKREDAAQASFLSSTAASDALAVLDDRLEAPSMVMKPETLL